MTVPVSTTTTCPRCARAARTELHTACGHCGFHGPAEPDDGSRDPAEPDSGFHGPAEPDSGFHGPAEPGDGFHGPAEPGPLPGTRPGPTFRDTVLRIDARLMELRPWIAAGVALSAWVATGNAMVGVPLLVVVPFLVTPLEQILVPPWESTDDVVEETLRHRAAVRRCLVTAFYGVLAAVAVGPVGTLDWPLRVGALALLVPAVGVEIRDVVELSRGWRARRG